MTLHIVISPTLCIYMCVYVTHMCILNFSVRPQAFFTAHTPDLIRNTALLMFYELFYDIIGRVP